ncbi:MAG: AAA family ATPase [Gemmatimonadetes bacterium]|nr:AAA family ATPase [Gemmatimonadota bacterium]NIQ56019.1 AAA family ATPase [Gemmatimonadota bacterium]NIU76220.1 AAA family ATPase [Gammaproteobacteria bacterium]NIX45735.1 AAA family ATPase [Gemmatimonadota bacterium]NIY10045.1 AAA family ATPase [Gemmatimonadota bacterium]
MIELRLLGPADATIPDGEVPPELLWRKNLALLAYLAMAPDRRAGREQLTGLLWGDKPDAAARHSLAEALRVLRRCTGDGVEDAGTGYVQLKDDAVETDTARFLERVEADDPAGAGDLVAGEFMEGFALSDAWEFEEWLAAQRRAWRSRSEDALVAAAEAALAAGAPEVGHDFAHRALALAPASDRACQAVMKSLCLRGDRGRALETYEAFAGWLDEALAIQPSDETEALAERVRRQRRWRLPADRTAREARGAESRRAPLSGRGSEMTALVDVWQACRDGAGARAVLIQGDAGTGRSRLLQELLGRARLDGAATAVVRALPADRDTGGAVVESLARAVTFDPEARGPALGDRLRELTGEAPLVLAVDDADWADEESLSELVAVPSRIPDAAIMIALAAGGHPGPAALARLDADLGRDVPGTRVRLGPLGPEALRELAAWAVPDYDETALERLTRRLEADTAGYPLLAVELLHAVAYGLALDEEAAPWPAAGRTLDQTRPGELPGSLVAAVRVGFRVLTRTAQRALAAVAVLDPPVPRERIARATGLEGGTLDEALDELEWERWLVADARGYTFIARLIREIVARDMVTAGQRSRILES